jgi:hypothetical protein
MAQAQERKDADPIREPSGNTGILVFVVIFVVLAVLAFVLWKQQPPDTGRPAPPSTAPIPTNEHATPPEAVPGSPQTDKSASTPNSR